MFNIIVSPLLDHCLRWTKTPKNLLYYVLLVPLTYLKLNVILKWFDRFIRVDSSKYSGEVGEDAGKFLNDYYDKLYNHRSFESHGVGYSTYQLLNVDRD